MIMMSFIFPSNKLVSVFEMNKSLEEYEGNEKE